MCENNRVMGVLELFKYRLHNYKDSIEHEKMDMRSTSHDHFFNDDQFINNLDVNLLYLFQYFVKIIICLTIRILFTYNIKNRVISNKLIGDLY